MRHIHPWLESLGLAMNRQLERFLFPVLLAFMILGWYIADTLASQKNLVPWLLAWIMLVTSLRSSFKDVTNAFRQPGVILFLLLLLHLLQPLLARLAAEVAFSDFPEITAGLVLSAAIPIGVTSVLWTGMGSGNVSLSLSALTVDTLLSPILLPAVLLTFSGTTVAFDPWQLVWDLILMIVLPAGAGVLCHELSRGSLAQQLQFFAGPTSKLALGLVLAINLANSRHALHSLPFPLWQLLLTVFLLVMAGYVLGALLPFWAGYPRETIIAASNAVGLRNLSAGIVICMRNFPPLTALPVLLGIFFQQPLAALMHRLFTRFLGSGSSPGKD